MKIKIVALLLAIFTLSFGFGCRSKTVVKKLSDGNTNQSSSKSKTDKIDGVMYHLPKTVVQISIPVKKVTKVRGEYWKFAPCFFSKKELEDFIAEDSKSFLIDSPTFSSRGIPDTSQTYVIKTKGKYFESKTLFLEYAPGYVMTKGEAESKNETLEFTVKALATAASVAAKITPLAISSGVNTVESEKARELQEAQKCFSMIKVFFDDGVANTKDVRETKVKEKTEEESKNPRNVERINELNELIAEIDRVVVKSQSLWTKFDNYITTPGNGLSITSDEQSFYDEYQTAKELYDEYQTLRKSSKTVLGRDNPNIPPDTFKMMLEKTEAEITSIRAAFLGSPAEKIWVANLEFIPEKDKKNSELLFAYSKTNGVCNNGQILKKSISIGGGFLNKNCGKTGETGIQILWLNVTRSNEVQQSAYLAKIKSATENAEEKDKSRGWFYRVPADGDISLRTARIPCKPLAEPNKYDCSPLSIGFRDRNIEIEQTKNVFLPVPNNFEQVALKDMPVAQLGEIASVPASTAGRSSSTAIMLDPATGAMKNYKVSSTALVDKSILDEAQKAANSAIDAADPLNKKKRELEELKTQNQINEEKKKLTNSNTENDEDN